MRNGNDKFLIRNFSLIVYLAWIPLACLAFFFSPVRIDIKLSIAAAVSFISMMVWMLKNE